MDRRQVHLQAVELLRQDPGWTTPNEQCVGGRKNGLRLAMKCAKPVIWKWIDTIRMVQIKSDFKINQFMCGGSNVSKKKKSEIKRQETMSRRL